MSAIKEYQLFIDGKWVTSTSGETIDIVNPTTEEIVARVQNGTIEEAHVLKGCVELLSYSSHHAVLLPERAVRERTSPVDSVNERVFLL